MKEFTVKDLVWTRPPRQFTISDEYNRTQDGFVAEDLLPFCE